jgi:hypothetical protein
MSDACVFVVEQLFCDISTVTRYSRARSSQDRPGNTGKMSPDYYPLIIINNSIRGQFGVILEKRLEKRGSIARLPGRCVIVSLN